METPDFDSEDRRTQMLVVFFRFLAGLLDCWIGDCLFRSSLLFHIGVVLRFRLYARV